MDSLLHRSLKNHPSEQLADSSLLHKMKISLCDQTVVDSLLLHHLLHSNTVHKPAHLTQMDSIVKLTLVLLGEEAAILLYDRGSWAATGVESIPTGWS